MKLVRNTLLPLAAITCLAIAAAAYETRGLWNKNDRSALSVTPDDIVVRGRLEPSEGVYELAAFSIAPTTAVGEILVSEGQSVSKGQIVATLRSRAQAAAGVESAKAALVVTERRLELTRRPYKDLVIDAQQATVQARIAEVGLAQSQLGRGEQLHQRGVASDEMREIRRAEVSRAQARLEEARAQLQATTEVPSREIMLAESEVAAAKARLHGAMEELALTEIVRRWTGWSSRYERSLANWSPIGRSWISVTSMLLRSSPKSMSDWCRACGLVNRCELRCEVKMTNGMAPFHELAVSCSRKCDRRRIR